MSLTTRGALLAAVLIACVAAAQAPPPPTVAIEKDVMVAARDGIRLATDIYFPASDGSRAAGPFPVIVERTPYDKEAAANVHRGIHFAQRGYVVIFQDVRGRFKSEGRWWMLVDDSRDGYDLLEWISRQPWSSGRVGTMGGSYTGATQHALAIARPPGLAAMFVRETVSNMGKIGLRHHGAFELRFMAWIFSRAVDSREANANPALRAALEQANADLPKYVRQLPLLPGATPLRLLPNYESWLVESMTHSDYDSYWKQAGYNVEEHYAEHADVPVYHETAWYDSWTRSSIDNYLGLTAVKGSPQRLIVGPWTHGGASRAWSGAADFEPDGAIRDYDGFMEAWFDRWLKGKPGPAGESPIRLFVMGGGSGRRTREGRIQHGGRWRDASTWPLAGTRFVPYYIHADGRLTPQLPGDAPATTYRFDPHRPVPTIGGNISSAAPLMEPGGYDQRCAPQFFGCDDDRPLASRSDVKVFQTGVLSNDIEVSGPLEVKLWVASSATDTDFTAKLVDVYPPTDDFPAGFALNLSDSIVRMRYRNRLDRQELLTPGAVVPVTMTLYPTANLFKAGHRIRLDISSSNFPRFDVNPNTGEPLGRNQRWAIATNSVYHDGQHPSHIVLPVVTR